MDSPISFSYDRFVVWTALVRRPMRKPIRINEEPLPRLRPDFFPIRRIPGQSTQATLRLKLARSVSNVTPRAAFGRNPALGVRMGNP